MVGCCGQGVAGQQKSPQGAQKPGVTWTDNRNMNMQMGVKSGKCFSEPHDEEICHGTGERRRDLIGQLKIFLEDFDERPCQTTPLQGAGELKPLGHYPEYLKKHCQSWMPSHPRPPLITSVQSHEIRPTEDYERKKLENSEYVTYVDARTKPPPPSCDCAKRNGLQDQCPRPECTPPTPQCLATNPGPCCPPSMGLTGREAQQGYGSGQQQGCGSSQQQGYGGSKHPSYNNRHQQQQQGQQEMICFCQASPASMPHGKKYLCCPVPL